MRITQCYLLFGILLCCLSCSQDPIDNIQDSGVVDTSGPKAFVIGMLGESGAFGLVSVKHEKRLPTEGSTSNDAVARYWNGYMFVVNRLTHDNIQVMETKSYSLIKQYSVGPKTNPQDIVILGEAKAYISRLGDSRLLVVEPLTGKQLKEIELVSLAETSEQSCQKDEQCDSKRCVQQRCASDGLPELSRMVRYKEHVWVLAQRLNRNAKFRSQHKGKIGIIRTEDDKVVKVLDTQQGNPYDVEKRDGTLYVSQPGNWLEGTKVVLDGVLEKFDLAEQKSLGVVLDEKTLGGNISSFAFASDNKAYVIRTGNNWNTELVSFDPKTGKVGDVILRSPCLTNGACYTLFSIVYHPSGKLFVVDRDPKKPGIRIIDTNTDKEVTQAPIQMTLPPMSLVFYE